MLFRSVSQSRYDVALFAKLVSPGSVAVLEKQLDKNKIVVNKELKDKDGELYDLAYHPVNWETAAPGIGFSIQLNSDVAYVRVNLKQATGYIPVLISDDFHNGLLLSGDCGCPLVDLRAQQVLGFHVALMKTPKGNKFSQFVPFTDPVKKWLSVNVRPNALN